MRPPHALIVDDEPHIAELLRDMLEAEKFIVRVAADGAAALRSVRADAPDIVILDIGLPALNGLDVCKILRKERSMPILFLSARAAEVDRIVALELGADDYVVKPFSPREVLARIRAILRRSGAPVQENAQARTAGEIRIDADRRETSVRGKAVVLKPREFDVLWLLVSHEGHVFTREKLIELVWGHDFEGDDRTVDVHVRRIRRALGDDARRPQYVHTVHGLGYKFSAGAR